MVIENVWNICLRNIAYGIQRKTMSYLSHDVAMDVMNNSLRWVIVAYASAGVYAHYSGVDR